jgi:UDP-N-acetylmuramoyl-L-alanyl-D-glutamate--2,6-diaminopimelate ligase
VTPRAARLSDLLATSGVGSRETLVADPEIQGAAIDSRRIEPGNLFLAMRGLRDDGASFAADAIRRGARAIVAGTPRPASVAGEIPWVEVAEPRRAAALLSRECYGRPDESLTLVGVTGTNGKTTVTWLLEAIARAAGLRVGRIGTTGYVWNGSQHAAERTTPEAPDFYRMLDTMRDGEIELVAMEVSSHALALERVTGARFAVAAFLNLGSDHLDFHADQEAYFAAKARLFEGLGPDARAVLPLESPWSERLRLRCRARTWSFGRRPGADVRLVRERSDLDGSSAELETPDGRLSVRTALAGRHNLDNVAAAAACALAAGLPAVSIPAGIESVRAIPGRMERVDRGQPFAVFVDFAHTAEALASLLDSVRDAGASRVLSVFGCGGSRDPHKRPEMGRVAAERSDLVFITSDNPRDEDPERILDAVEQGVARAGASARTSRLCDRRLAIREALGAARAGDAVVIAGRGHETLQELGGERRPFDDRIVAVEALAELGYRGESGAEA